MYAIVRAGGRQEKVTLGDVIEVDRLEGQPGDTVNLAPVLVVDGSTVTSAAQDLQAWPVSAEIVGDSRGPKITILKFKNKTGYRKRQGHRSQLTALRVVSIGSQTWAAPSKAKTSETTESTRPEAKKAQAPKAGAKTTQTAKSKSTPETTSTQTASKRASTAGE